MERSHDGLVLCGFLSKVALCLHYCIIYIYDGNGGGIGESLAWDLN